MASWCQADTEVLGDTMTWAELLNFCTAIRLPVPPALLKAAWADATGHTLDRQHQLDTRAPSGTGTQWHHEQRERWATFDDGRPTRGQGEPEMVLTEFEEFLPALAIKLVGRRRSLGGTYDLEFDPHGRPHEAGSPAEPYERFLIRVRNPL